MAQQRLGIIMNGVTGRMGMNQHLIRSICAIRAQGGVALQNGDRVMPDPILVGRNADRVQKLAQEHGIARWTTDLDKALADPNDTLFFDAATTQLRAGLLMALEAPGGWAEYLARQLLVHGRIDTPAAIVARIEACSVDDVRAAGAKMLRGPLARADVGAAALKRAA